LRDPYSTVPRHIQLITPSLPFTNSHTIEQSIHHETNYPLTCPLFHSQSHWPWEYHPLRWERFVCHYPALIDLMATSINKVHHAFDPCVVLRIWIPTIVSVVDEALFGWDLLVHYLLIHWPYRFDGSTTVAEPRYIAHPCCSWLVLFGYSHTCTSQVVSIPYIPRYISRSGMNPSSSEIVDLLRCNLSSRRWSIGMLRPQNGHCSRQTR
jgi:hypothetical protein